MGKKQGTQQVVKLQNLKTDNIFGINSGIDGFSINIAQSILLYEPFLDYFRSDYFMLILVSEGKANLGLNLKDYNVKRNDLLRFTPYDIKILNSYENCVASVIFFTAEFLESFARHIIATDVFTYFNTQYSPQWALEEQDAQLVHKRFIELAHNQTNLPGHPYGKELLHLSFSSLLYEIMALGDKYSGAVNKNISRKENLVINFTNLVRLHSKKERGLHFYGSQLNITSKYLTETVKEVTLKSASEIIESFVIQEARMLLDNPKLSIAEIAEELNFSDQSFFGKFFKRVMGRSPKDYRNSL
ncbi:helix-turn-helix domain-containing protein [Flavobacterium sp. CSZ]|uniref:helix-turn-helix domain-containing protein n=1 Tax=Flavobacterium sp. CSZ TaxID=2783791 RepID=UPI00188D4CF9|nr:helix-turn-helix domain-containing protein [Flavobacterium sp. CSZ]MBF4485722.1 AraC family transcriptional regulator [Flavobacterium sp. CSZ]